MDDLARRGSRVLGDLVLVASERLGLTPAVIEKDFWVCWILKRLFSLEGFAGAFVFKGGTCNSKVYRVIDRFSEDIDLVWDRESLGFAGEKDPLSESVSRTRAEKTLLPALEAEAMRVVQQELAPTLQRTCEVALNHADFRIDIVVEEKQPVVLFHYPTSGRRESKYVKPQVKIELVPRSEKEPSAEASITPYLSDALPELLSAPAVRVRHITVARTLWEKATILHMYHHSREDKTLGGRCSRHYYDLYRLIQLNHLVAAMDDLELLRAVVRHKKRIYRTGTARYDDVLEGRLRLVPPDSKLPALREDYAAMAEMLFGTPPPLDEILAILRTMEETVNARFPR